MRHSSRRRWLVTADAQALPDAGPDAAHVVIESVGKTFRRAGRRTVALSGINLRVAPGGLVCLLGPSGCGKSTLLRIVAGGLASPPGSVILGGPAVAGPAPPPGVPFPSPQVFPSAT